MKPNTTAHVETWELMDGVKQAVGLCAMQKIFSVGHGQINRYCRNPDFTEDSERDPIKRLGLILKLLPEKDASKLAFHILSYLADQVDLEIKHKTTVLPDKATIHEELFDNHPKLVEYEQSILDGDPAEVRAQKREALIHELMQDEALCCQRRAE